MALPLTFLMIYSAFREGYFTVKHTTNGGSGVRFDQALEKEYKSAKGSSGIIGYTRRKESVLKWNIIHHEKRKFTDFCEYSLHHQISDVTTKANETCVSLLVNYILQRGNAFNTENQGI